MELQNIEQELLKYNLSDLFVKLDTSIAKITEIEGKSQFKKAFKFFKVDWLIEHQNEEEIRFSKYIYKCLEKLKNLDKTKLFHEDSLKKFIVETSLMASSEENYGIMPAERFAAIDAFQKRYSFQKNAKLATNRFLILHSSDKRVNFLFYRVFNTFNFYFYIFKWGEGISDLNSKNEGEG